MTKQLLTYPIIAEFLSTLRMEGHLIGVGKHLQIQSLLKQLPDDIDIETLKLAIVPLIAQSPQEQERLYETFDQCVKRVEEQQPLPTETTPSVFDDNFSSEKISRWKILMMGLLLTLLIGGGIYWYSENQKKKVPPIVTPQLPTTTPDPNDTLKVETTKPITDSLSYFVENKPYPFPDHLDDYDIDISSTQQWLSNNWSWLRWVLATFLTAFLVAIWRYRAWKRRKLVAQQDPNDKPPYIWNINIEGVEPVLMGDSLERVTQMLRQRSQTDTMRLDVERTVNATIEQGGMPLFKYRRLTSPTDYLLLIDRQTVRNHRAQLFDALYESFKSQEVEIARYFFDSDVRVCYNEDYPHGVPLSDLQQRYYQARLLIVGTGAQLLSPLSGKAAAWTTVFNQWRNRALFSPKPLKSWGYDERQLSTLFTTLPATLQSLGFWVEELDAGADAHFDDWQEKIDDAPQAPILPDDNDPLPVLQLFFEPNIVRWIAACAIYPTLHWDLTLWLGQNIETRDANGQKNTPLSNFDSLSQICRLSWFVKGEMPNETRTALLNWLEKYDAPLLNHLRAAIAIELQKNPPPKDSAAFDKFRMNIALNQWLTTTDAKEKKQLEDEISQFLEKGTEPDFTVIKYLNAPRTALDFIVPDAWKKFVHPSGFSALGWVKEWKDLWWLIPMWVLGLVLLFANYTNNFTNVDVVILDKYGNSVFTEGSVTMIEDSSIKGLINEQGKATFNEVKIGSKFHLSIDFSNDYPPIISDSIYTISKGKPIYLLIGSTKMSRIFGNVYSQDKRLEGVLVDVIGLRDTTDSTGIFEIIIPKQLQKKDYEVRFLKEGFKMTITKAFPQTNEPLNVVLESNFAMGPCRDYTCVIEKIERLIKQSKKDYKAILDNLDAAEGYPDSKPEQIRMLRRRVFNLIENEVKEARKGVILNESAKIDLGGSCSNYACSIAKIERLLKQPKKDYKAILDNLDAAEGYQESKPEQIHVLRRETFVALENELKSLRKNINSSSTVSTTPSVSSITSTNGQSYIFGNVSLFNSQFENGKKIYIANVQIEDDYGRSTPTTTDQNGNFRLVLIGYSIGEKVFFNVKKATYEVVNTDALQAVAGQKEAVQVYLAKKGVLAENKRKYYQINRTASEKAVTEKLVQLGQQIETLQQNKEANKTKIEALQAEYARLQESFKKIEETARELAERYAKINLDDASIDYQKSFRSFQRGVLDSTLLGFQKIDLERNNQNSISTILAPATVFVKGGTFTMGCTKEQGGDCGDDEKPAHQVTLSDFNMGQFEVTVEQYLQFADETKTHYPEWLEKGNNYNIKTGNEDLYKKLGDALQNPKNPIVGVSHTDATAYCQWLSRKSGKNYRLPTEAEWEYAARGGSKSGNFKYSGSNNVSEVAWYNDNSDSKTHTVGTKKANELGIYDMSGNVWEWCSDWYESYNNNAVRNPIGAAKGSNRVYRGGSWNDTSQSCRAPHRNYHTPAFRFNSLGFRVVSSLQ